MLQNSLLASGGLLLGRSCRTSLSAEESAAPGKWRARASIPWVVQEVYGTVLEGHGVIAGGMARDAEGQPVAIDRVGIYDPAADRWTEAAPLPETRHHPSLATVGSRVYAIGGATHIPGKGLWNQRTDVFVLSGGVWTRGTSLPEPQFEAVALVHDGRIHLISGRTAKDGNAKEYGDHRDVATHRVFDVQAGKWANAMPISSPRNSAAGAVIEGRLYVVGGRTMAGGNSDRLERYDPVADRWEALRPMPHAAGGLAAAALGGSLYVVGGEELTKRGADGVIRKTWRYHPPTDRWEAVADMLTPRHGLAALALGESIFAIGGGRHVGLAETSDVVEAFTPVA